MGTKRFGSKQVKAIVQECHIGNDKSVPIYGPYYDAQTDRHRVVIVGSASRKTLSFSSKAEAERVIAALQQEIAQSTPTTVGQALDDYLQYKERCGLKPPSMRSLQNRLSAFLPLEEAVSALSERRCQALYDKLTESRSWKNTRLAAATHQAVLRNTKEFFRWLVEKKVIAASPWTGVKPIGRAQAGKRQLRQSEAEQLDRVLMVDAERGNEGALALLLQIYTGLRSGEILGLKVSDVEVVKARTGQQTQVHVTRGKTKNARRCVKVYEGVAALLRRHCQGLAAGSRVFASRRAAQPAANWLYKRLKTYAKRMGFAELCPHSLRGLNATLALEGGATTDAVARSLGHGSFAITEKHYADPSAVVNARVARIAAALGSDDTGIERLLDGLTPAQRERLRAALAAG